MLQDKEPTFLFLKNKKEWNSLIRREEMIIIYKIKRVK